MPYVHIRTNKPLDKTAAKVLLVKACGLIAKELGKPEGYMMASLEDGMTMLFAGNDSAAAYLEVRSIGMPEDKTEPLSRGLCELIHAGLGIPLDRIYINFMDISRPMWGYNSTTF